MATSSRPQDWREGRRLRAWELHQQGWKQKDIAAALGVSPGAVSQWIARGRAQGGASLRHHTPPGAPARLTAEQREQLKMLLACGAETFGFRGDVWTTARVAALVKREFQVTYHPAHISRLLRALGWSVQQPIERASQRDEAAIRAWREERWPALKKRPLWKAEPSCG